MNHFMGDSTLYISLDLLPCLSIQNSPSYPRGRDGKQSYNLNEYIMRLSSYKSRDLCTNQKMKNAQTYLM